MGKAIPNFGNERALLDWLESNYSSDLGSTPFTFSLPFTLGVDKPASNTRGMLIGRDSVDAAAQVEREDNSAGTFTDETTDAADDATGDVTLPQPM